MKKGLNVNFIACCTDFFFIFFWGGSIPELAIKIMLIRKKSGETPPVKTVAYNRSPLLSLSPLVPASGTL